MEKIEILKNKKGKQASYEENRQALTVIHQLLLEGHNRQPAIDRASELLHSSNKTLGKLLQHYDETKEVLEPDTSNRGRGSARYIYAYALDREHAIAIQQYIVRAHGKGRTVTVPDLIKHLDDTFNIIFSAKMIYGELHRTGYIYGSMDEVPVSSLSPARIARKRAFFLEYFKYLTDPNCIIVYTDETYCHTNLSSSYSWYNPEDPATTELQKPEGKGIRIIILHACSSVDGMLAERDSIGYIPASSSPEVVQNTCELIYESKNNDENYHNSMNGEVFVLWIKNRLFPTFKKLHPDKKLVLVLDNASFHHHRGKDYVSISPGNKKEYFIELCKKFGLKSVTVDRKIGNETKKITFNEDKFNESGRLYGPTKEELMNVVKLHIEKNPGLQKTEVKKLFDEQGYYLLYTPPYLPTVQPIETVWANMKNHVRKQFEHKRLFKKLVQNKFLE